MSNVVPEGWRTGSFSDFATINPKLISDVTLTAELKVSFIKMEDVSNDAQVKNMHVKNYAEVSKGFTKFNDHDVLVAKITPCFENGKGGYAEHLVNGIGFGSTEFHVLRAKKDTDSKYIYQYTNYDSFRLAAEASMCGTGGQRRVQTDFIKTHKVIFPPLSEQKKIAAILTSVDEVIEKTQAQIDKLKDLKTAMMQELLTCGVGVDGKPHTEFKDSPVGRIPKEWEVLPLSKLAKLERGRFSHRPRNDPSFYNGKIPFLQTGDIPKGSPYIQKFSQTLNDKGLKVSKLFPAGSLVITIAATIGEIGILEFESCFPDSLVGMKVNAQVADSMFILYVMRHLKEDLDLLAPQTAQKNINLDILNPFLVPVPPLHEQKIISKSLELADSRINLLDRKLDKLKNTKKALMQDLLTGKVRVKVD